MAATSDDTAPEGEAKENTGAQEMNEKEKEIESTEPTTEEEEEEEETDNERQAQEEEESEELLLSEFDQGTPRRVARRPEGDETEIEIVELDPLPSPQQNLEKALAWDSLTPCVATWGIPLLCVITHILFLYGQIEPMWRLTQSQSVDAWFNATDKTSHSTFDILGLDYNQHLVLESNSTIKTFTYSYAITELWEARGMPGTTIPRVAAVLLAIFSGLWPHLKLLLLNLTWLTLRAPQRRTRVLHWLSCLGKWSLADILVVCVMVGVLHVDWIVHPDQIMEGVTEHLPYILHLISTQYNPTEICTYALKYDCEHPSKAIRKIKCTACVHAVKTGFGYPDWTNKIIKGIEGSGGGIVSLRVVGMRGIYVFCAAVVVSILLSLFIDVINHSVKKQRAKLAEQQREIDEAHNIEADGDPQEPLTRYTLVDDPNAASAPLLQTPRSYLQLDQGSVMDADNTVSIRISLPWLTIFHAIMSLGVLVLALFSCFWISMVRRVDGAVPTVLHNILGIEWVHHYSLQTLGETTGAAGGWDLLLMATFSLFVVFGPILRSVLCVVGHIWRRSFIQSLIDFIGAFCAWEVLVLAVVMICLLMPSITGTIIEDSRCREVDEAGTCFLVEFQVLETFVMVLVCGILLVIVSNTFSFLRRR